jgi:diguanylate cyclase (GGDEF)-like protein
MGMKSRGSDPLKLRTFLARIVAQLGNPLEWTDVDKSIVLFGSPIPFVILYILRIEQLVAHPEAEPYIDRPSLIVVERLLIVTLAVFVMLFLTWLVLRRREGAHDVFVRTTIYAWFSAMALAAYAVGPYSSTVLLGFLAGGMTAFLLFDVRRAATGAALGLSVIIVTTILERMGVLAYGPVFANVLFSGQRPPDPWVLWNALFTVTLTCFVLGATGVVMTLARTRQAELTQLLRTDTLTGLVNRRTLERTLEREVARASRFGAPLAVVLLDLDHFKNVNDTHGHRAGDAVLTAVGGVMLESVRNIDLAGRYGGEELMLVLPETDIDGARIAAERVRVSIEALSVPIEQRGVVKVTASAGCAVLGAEGVTDVDSLVRAADAALYRAKASGRNRVET